MTTKPQIIKEINGKDVSYIESPNFSSLIGKPNFIIVHYTASTASAESIARFFSRRSSKVSAHFVIGEDGRIIQCVPLNKAAWHAGKSSWFEYRGLNKYSIGIEVCNPGILKALDDGTYMAWNGRKIKDSSIFRAKHPVTGTVGFWKPFTENQIESLLALGRYLVRHFDIIEVLGHDMIAPFRKIDPGPCIDPKIYDMIIGDRSLTDERYYFEGRKIKVTTLYHQPSDEEVLKVNKYVPFKVQVVDRIGYWFKVYSPLYGMVYTKIGKISAW